MKFDADKLTNDLIHANKVACDHVEKMDDGGTANLDRVFLRVPRVKETLVLDSIRNAGLYCRRKTDWIGSGYMISPKTDGQGNKRSKAVEIMAYSLRDAGHDVYIFCHND